MARNKENIGYSESARDYENGYRDGIKEALENSEIHAYYAGVGYGKHRDGNTNLGFNTEDERQSFHAGINNKDKHFNSYRYERPGFFERLFSRFSESSRIKRKEKKRKKAIRSHINNRKSEREMLRRKIKTRKKLKRGTNIKFRQKKSRRKKK